MIFLALITGELNKKTHVIDLNVKPSRRYEEIVFEHKDLILQLYKLIKEKVKKEDWELIARSYETVIQIRYKQYTEELEGIARILSIAASDAYVYNCIYELLLYVHFNCC